MRRYKTAVFDNKRWDGFEPRPDDIFVCTPAKCGTTWTQTIVASLLWPQGDAPAPVMQLSPWIEAVFVPREMMNNVLEGQTHRRFMKSHTPADGIPWFDEAKYVFVARAGKDAFMSMCNHMQRMKNIEAMNVGARKRGVAEMAHFDGDYRGFFATWLANPNNFFHIAATFWERRHHENLLLVHFDDLKANLNSEMRRIATFLDINVDEADWPGVVERCTFDGMRARAEEIGDFDMMFEGGAQGFIFKGTNGRWRDVLTSEDLVAYEARARELLGADALEWLEREG